MMSLLSSGPLLITLGSVVTIVGIILGWWSFKFGEAGAVRDFDGGGVTWFDDKQHMLLGQRTRARDCARVTFVSASLSLIAGVLIGLAGASVTPHSDILAAVGYFALLGCLAYACKGSVEIWTARRSDAFSIYFGKEMWPLYDKNITKQIYFSLNPMPIWSLPDREWFLKRTIPDIQDVYKKASKAAPSEFVDA
jgi:hypothetical protein